MRTGSEIVRSLLSEPGVTKSSLAEKSGVSRALIDSYLKGKTEPSLKQIDRLASAAGRRIDVRISEAPRPVPPAFAAVLEFGDMFPRKPKEPLPNMSATWRAATARWNDKHGKQDRGA